MNLTTLNQKLDAIRSFERCPAESVGRLGDALRGLDDWELLRINPIRFAEEHAIREDDCVELFVHGAKVGLFDFVWNLICPHCGGVVTSGESINAFRFAGHCAMCAVTMEGHLDDQIEVAFAINGAVRALAVDPYASAADYWRYYFSPNFVRSERVEALVREAILGVVLPGPDESAALDFEAEPGREYGIVSVERHVAASLEVGGAGDPSEAVFDLLSTGLHPASATVAPGRVRLTVRNLSKARAGVALTRDDERIAPAMAEEPPRLLPFLTGKRLLNLQSFRDLFRVQQLVPGLRLPLRSLTILFTDLKGSTELYDRTGDAYAYALVQEHYAHLTEAVRENAGAVIKTMGDAIMASFSRPVDAARAAVAMMDRIDRLDARWRLEGHDLGLKIGLHEGPALAVNADDRLDYFGQTVNIAARVQGLAQAGEIWHTDEVLRAEGVEPLLRSGRFDESAHSVSLKGVGRPVLVHRWRRERHSDR